MGDLDRVELLDSSIPLGRLTGVLHLLRGVWSSLGVGVWTTGLDWVSGTGITLSILRFMRVHIDIKSSKLVWLICLGRDGNSKLLASETMVVSPCWSGVTALTGVVPAGVPWATGPASLAESSTAESCWSADWGQFYFTSGHMWQSRLVHTLTSSMMTRLRHMIHRCLRWRGPGPMMLMMIRRRPDMRRPPRSTARLRTVRRVSLLGSGAGPSRRRRGPGPLPTLTTPRWMTRPGRVVTSLRPVTTISLTPFTTVRPMVFRSLGPGRVIGPRRSSHHRNTGWNCLRLLVTGPGRPVGRLCLRSLRRGRGGCFHFLRRVLVPRRLVLSLLDGRKSIFRCMDFYRVVHVMGSLSCRCRLVLLFLSQRFVQRSPSFRKLVLANVTWRILGAESQAIVEAALLTSVVVIAPSSIVRAARKLQLQLHGWRPITWLCHLVLLSKSEQLFTQVGIKSNSEPKGCQKHPLLRPTGERSKRPQTNFVSSFENAWEGHSDSACQIHIRTQARQELKWQIGGCRALLRCGCARKPECDSMLFVLKFRLGSAGEQNICSHCHDVLNEDRCE